VSDRKTTLLGTITGGRGKKRSGILGLFSNSKVIDRADPINFYACKRAPQKIGPRSIRNFRNRVSY
jgi:hypothetical protein